MHNTGDDTNVDRNFPVLSAGRGDAALFSPAHLPSNLEGIDTLEHPGITYGGPGHDRRAALAGGPDVWEIVARLRELVGSEDERIETLAAECELHPRQLHIALAFAAQYRHDIEARIARHDNAIAATRIAAEERRALFG